METIREGSMAQSVDTGRHFGFTGMNEAAEPDFPYGEKRWSYERYIEEKSASMQRGTPNSEDEGAKAASCIFLWAIGSAAVMLVAAKLLGFI